MSISVPIFALGVATPNPTFTRQDGLTPGKAAGWTASSAGNVLTEDSIYGASPDRGHVRVQRYTLGSTGSKSGTVLSAPSTPGMLCGNVSTYITGFLLIKTSGLGASNTVALKIQWYNSSGTALGSPTTILTRTSDSASWSVIYATITATPPGNADHFRLSLVFTRTSISTAAVVDIQFCAVGTYTSAAGTFTSPRVLGSETRQRPGYNRSIVVDAWGVSRVVSRDRYVGGRTMQIVFPLLLDSERQSFDYIEQMNYGRDGTGDENPGGGQWPLIIVPGLSGAPAVLMVNIQGSDGGIAEGDKGWRPDPPNWTLAWSVAEVV